MERGADPCRVLGGVTALPEALFPRPVEFLRYCSADKKQSPNDGRERPCKPQVRSFQTKF